MSDDYGTVGVRRSDRAREIELLRQRYRQHREALMRLVTDAPSEHLASEYHRLVRDVDSALAKIDEIEGRNAAAASAASAGAAAAPFVGATVPPAVPPRSTTPVGQVQGDPLRAATEPGARPLIPSPGAAEDADRGSYTSAQANGSSRVLLITAAGILVLAVIGWLIWRASSDRKAAHETTTAPIVATDTAPATIVPVTATAPASALSVAPAVVDFGNVTKGTRAARQLEVTNNGTTPVTIQVSRSQCRCLFYEYAAQVAPKKKETVTVTLDGGRAKAGALDETITISAKKDPSLTTTFQVTGTVK